MARAFTIVRGAFTCDTPELRALALEGLGTSTSEDLATASTRRVGGVDPDCRAYLSSGAPEVSGRCLSYPRWAGTWLAARCNDGASARALEIAGARPRDPFDPLADPLIDGALRVLAACDVAGFEQAIAHLPETSIAASHVRGRDEIRAMYRDAVPTSLVE